MYVGHVGIALAMRAETNAPPLALLALAAQGPDWIDAVRGLAHAAPVAPGWSAHGFPLLVAGAALSAGAATWIARARREPAGRAALLVALAYLSHWIADFFTGWKPTWPGGPVVGLGWYGRPPRDLAFESIVIVGGWLMWRRALPARAGETQRSHPLAWAMLAVLLALQVAADLVMARGLRLA